MNTVQASFWQASELGMKFVDAHIHLSDPEYSSQVTKIIEEAKESNVVALVSSSMDYESCQRNLTLAKENKGLVYAALGIHPWNVTNLTQKELEQILALILQHGAECEKVVAIGEIGLDPQYAKRRETKDRQMQVFQEMLSAAEKLGLPVIVHSRWSAQKILPILTSYHLKGVLFHWFSSPNELIPQMVERGYYISEGPPAVFSDRTKEIVKQIPIANLLTETDGPVSYYGPFEGKLTTPAFIPLVVKAVAEIKNMREEEVAEQILKNFVSFFRIEEPRL
jgi:TatD DNase family protein